MVFENVVKTLLNKYLGEYVENLDTNQLNIGIWGGNVELNNLQMKKDALKDLDLPIEVVYGYLGKLSLKMPWKNLYTEPVEACIDQLYIFAKPTKAVKYNAEKEERREIDAKKSKLKLLEESRQAKEAVDKLKVDKSFAEKLVLQVVNNIQIKVSNIHIRYEDKSSFSTPFACGFTLKSFSVSTTNSDWVETFMKEALAKTFKAANLVGLAVYFNCTADSFDNYESTALLEKFHSTISTEDSPPTNYNCILGPITSVAKLKLNSTPEDDDPPFGVPKVNLTIEMKKITLGITKDQYKNIIELTESMDRSIKGAPYRKFRPYETPIKGNARIWWKFAYECVAETHIRKRKLEWSWAHMSRVRNWCRKYEAVYKSKKISKKPSAEILQQCDELEEKLDLFNLIRIQNMVDIAVSKMQLEKPEKKGWFSSWFGGSKEESKSDDTAIVAQIGAAMTPEEKAKLFTAIGYQEQATPMELPMDFVAVSFTFELKLLEIVIRKEYLDLSTMKNHDTSLSYSDPSRVLLLQLHTVHCDFFHRPSASSIKLNLRMKDFSIYGMEQEGFVPQIIKSELLLVDEDQLSLDFETNPLDNSCDQNVKLRTRPLQITYDGQTVLELLEILKPPKDFNISEIQDAAAIKMADVKERSATGLEYMVKSHTRLNIDIILMPIYVIVPFGGKYEKETQPAVVVSLGTVKVSCKPRNMDTTDIQTLYREGKQSEEILQNVLDMCYDIFNLHIENVQILYVAPKENFSDVILSNFHTDMHVLLPTTVELAAHICLIHDDPRMPKTKLSGRLPYFGLSVSQVRILDILRLLLSIPVPKEEAPATPTLKRGNSLYQSTSSLATKFLENEKARTRKREIAQDTSELADEMQQFTNITVDFIIQEIEVALIKGPKSKGSAVTSSDTTPSESYSTPAEEFNKTVSDSIEDSNKLIVFKMHAIEMFFRQRMYDSKINLNLGGISIDQYFGHYNKILVIPVITTPRFSDLGDDYLMKIKYLNSSRDSPEFTTRLQSVEQLINVQFSKFVLCLHQEGILDLLRLADDLQKKMAEVTDSTGAPKDRMASAGSPIQSIAKAELHMIAEEDETGEEATARVEKKKSKNVVVDSVKLKLVAKLEQVTVKMNSLKRPISQLQVENLSASVVLKSAYTEVAVNLKDIILKDLNTASSYSQIMSVVGDAIDGRIVMFNLEETMAYNSYDMKVELHMGGMKFVFINWFLQSILNFLDHFQAAQRALVSASTAAAGAAKQNVVDAYEKAFRINLNVKIKAPIIIVPIDSHSFNGLCLDLGYIRVSNHLTDITVENAVQNPAVIDEMKLELNEIKLFKVTIDESSLAKDVLYDSVGDSNILDPTSFSLNVLRNLSASWYKERPDLEISGRMKSIIFNLLASDYSVVMNILDKNLTEGANERTIAQQNPSPKVETPTSTTRPASSQSAKKTTTSAVVEPEKRTTIATFLKFAFKMDSLVINLFTQQEVGLASFGIFVLSLKGNMLVDGSMNTSIVLYDIQLDDTRPKRHNMITRYMSRKVDDNEPEDEKKSMIDVTCYMKTDSMFAEVRINSFDLIISMDFLMKLAAFLDTPGKDAAPKVPSNQLQPPKTPTSKAITGVEQAPVLGTPTTEVNNKHVTIIVHIGQPDIILMEKMEDACTNALYLNCEVNLKYRQEGEKQNIQGEMQNLNLHMCEFTSLRKTSTKYFIVQPVSITINGSTPDNKGLNLAVKISDINISISPIIIELLNRILAQTTATETEKVIEEDYEDYSNLWIKRSFREQDYWFNQIEVAQEAVNLGLVVEQPKQEICTLEMPSLVVKIETGYGNYTIPMLRFASDMTINVRNWSSSMNVDGSLHLGMSYYNSILAMWEPLIEPNEITLPGGGDKSQPWELNLGLSMVDNIDDISNESYKTTKVLIQSPETLELTVTKTCIEVLQDLGQAFTEVMNLEFKAPTSVAPYFVQNDTGFEITLNLKAGSFYLHDSHLPRHDFGQAANIIQKLVFGSENAGIGGSDVVSCTIPPGDGVYLDLKESEVQKELDESRSIKTAIDSSKLVQKEKYLHVQIGQIDKVLTVPVYKTDKRYFPLYKDTHEEPWGIVSEVVVEYGITKLNLHGVVQVQNHFAATVIMHRKKGDRFEEIHEIPPNSLFNVPLYSIYHNYRDWHFCLANYKPSVQGINWKDSPSDFNYKKYLQCDPLVNYEPFYMNAIRKRTEVYHELSSKHTMLSVFYVFDLRPPVLIRNTLPIPLIVSVANSSVVKDSESDEKLAQSIKAANESKLNDTKNQSEKFDDFLDSGEKIISPGELLQLPTIKLAQPGNDNYTTLVVRLVKYLEKDWSCSTEVPQDPKENSVWTFYSYDSKTEMTFCLGVHYENLKGSLIMSVYCPFWMVNKTGLMLSYRKSRKTEKNEQSGNSPSKIADTVNILYHPPEYEGPILFSYPCKNFSGKKKTSVRVGTGEWSDKFSLDVAGSSGMVACKTNDVTYQIAVHNTLTEYSLTKKITFMPFYVLVNKAPFDIEVQEALRPSDPWVKVPADKVVPLWPKTEQEQTLRVRCTDDPKNVTPAFRYTDVQISLLKLENNKNGGIYVDVAVTEGGVFITFTKYVPGNAPALILNNTDVDVSFYEKNNVNERILRPCEQMMYTWADPAGERLLYWHNKDNKATIETDLQKDEIGMFELTNQDHSKIYYVSFLDGLQRVLLFTKNEASASETQYSSQFNKFLQEIEIDIFGIGLSLVNNNKAMDILYVGIASTDIIWEIKKKSNFKRMSATESQIIEERYQEYLRNQVIGGPSDTKYLIDLSGTEVNFDDMKIIKGPKNIDIKRTFYPGLWFQRKISPLQTQTHAKINRIQIDNQTPDPIFPVIFSPVAPPKSVAAIQELKPFIEASIVERSIPYSNVKQFKYLKMLIQEFHVKIDIDFVTEIVQMVSLDDSDEKREKRFQTELHHLTEPLDALVNVQSTQEQKNFYDLLHLGPIKVHVSFSMMKTETQSLPPVFSTLMSGIGVTLTDVNDVVFRLAFFERNYMFLTQRKLTSECVSHYAGQALKQLYVLVFGLDVLGNPYGLVVGIKKGVEDLFYEPFQGLIQGPGEFAQGLVLGVRSLFGHTVGGAAGAVSKITGAVGKGLATLTFDKDYQKKRREQMNRKPANLQEGLARSGKGLVLGVFDGVTGVVSKPISGAREEGFGGFVKGLGKGTIGLFTKPTSGVIDFASGGFEAVKRATEMQEEVRRLRPPRYLTQDGVVKPYSKRVAEGNKLLKEVEKGKYAATDTLVHYEPLTEQRRILLVSDYRILYCSKQDMFGTWTVEWTYRFHEIQSFEDTSHSIVVTIKDVKKKLFGLADNKKSILIDLQARRNRLMDILTKLLNDSRKNL